MNKIPQRIKLMIAKAWENNEKAVTVTARINNSATAKKTGTTYSVRQIAAAMAWHTMRDKYGK